jgi:hypothetical protein
VNEKKRMEEKRKACPLRREKHFKATTISREILIAF